MIYTGIGSRQTPAEILEQMKAIAVVGMNLGWHLRSGGAPGADTAFERGVRYIPHQSIYIPWQGFSKSGAILHFEDMMYAAQDEAYRIASHHHPNWDNLKPAVKKLMARNVFQVLGHMIHKRIELSKFVVCWTQDGCEHGKDRTFHTGGTGLAISVASEYDVPVYNLFHHGRFKQVIQRLIEGKST